MPGSGFGAALDDPVEDLRAGGLGEGGEFAQRVLGVGEGAFGPEAGQDDALKAQLPVFDLGDVFEFGGQPGRAAQGVPFLEVLLVAVEVAVFLVQAGDRLRLAEHRRRRWYQLRRCRRCRRCRGRAGVSLERIRSMTAWISSGLMSWAAESGPVLGWLVMVSFKGSALSE